MDLKQWIDQGLPDVSNLLKEINEKYFFQESTIGFAGKIRIYQAIESIRAAFFPELFDGPSSVDAHIAGHLREAALNLSSMIERVLQYQCENRLCDNCNCREHAQEITILLFKKLPEIRETLQTDIAAAYNGDPAAKYQEEIVLSYPSVEALSVYRTAHFLTEQKVPLIPRIMTEYAHQKTGIDINPGAKIGDYCFIDHGTGVVIGETATIGSHVKIYQGVTLGAKSFPLDANGNPIKNIKRHPDIEDNVVIYAGATILGGDTCIGHDSDIGGNVWLTHSVPPFSKVYNAQPAPYIKQKDRKKKCD